MNGEISVNELAAETGYTTTNIGQLIKRGILPSGRKEGKTRYLPYVESKMVLSGHKPGEHWVKNRARPGKRKHSRVQTPEMKLAFLEINKPKDISWDDVL